MNRSVRKQKRSVSQRWAGGVGNTFVGVPDELLDHGKDLGLRGADLLVLVGLLRHYWGGEPIVYPTQETLAKLGCISASSVKRAVDRLGGPCRTTDSEQHDPKTGEPKKKKCPANCKEHLHLVGLSREKTKRGTWKVTKYDLTPLIIRLDELERPPVKTTPATSHIDPQPQAILTPGPQVILTSETDTGVETDTKETDTKNQKGTVDPSSNDYLSKEELAELFKEAKEALKPNTTTTQLQDVDAGRTVAAR